MLFQHSIDLDCPPEKLAEKLREPMLFAYVSWPILQFKPVDPATPPERWGEQKAVVKLSFLGVLPMGRHTLNISFRDRSVEKGKFWFEMRDDGFGQLVKKWDHTMTVRQNGGGCVYGDNVEIKAGPLTPFVWLFAMVLYRHRQRRLKRLAEGGFVFPALFGK